MALEDAAVLGNLLSHISSISHLPTYLCSYERLRHTRASKTQASSRLNQHVFHLPDGPEQQSRDNSMREAMQIEFARLKEKQSNDRRGSYADTTLNEGNVNQCVEF